MSIIEDLISWPELAEDVGENPEAAYMRNAVLRVLFEIITAAWRDQFPQNLPVSVLADRLKMDAPEKVTPDQALARLDEVLRMAPPQTPAPLSAARTGLEVLQSDGLPVADLAFALGLPAGTAKDAVRAELRRLAHTLFPDLAEKKEITARLKVIGMSASMVARSCLPHRWLGFPGEQTLRGMMAETLCGPQPQAAAFNATQFIINRLSSEQVLALGVSLIAGAARQHGSRVETLHALIGRPGSGHGAQVVTLRASAGARPGALPQRMVVLDWGVNETLKGRVVVDDTTLRVFDANQRQTGRERVALDYEHNTVDGSPEYNRTTEPRPVAAYWTPQVIRGEGIVLVAPTWTPNGEANALNFEDISAAPYLDGQRVVGLHSVALTKAGASDFTFLNVPELPGAVVGMTAPRTLFAAGRGQLATLSAGGELRGLDRCAAAWAHLEK